MGDIKLKRNLLVITVAMYIIVSSIAIFSAWINGTVPAFYLGYTVSIYVGLQKWTSAVYFAGMVLNAGLLCYFLTKVRMNIIRKILYYLTLIFLIGLAWFPVQKGRPESLASRGHEIFSDAFFIGVIVTLAVMFFSSRKISHRVYAVCGILFGIYYITGYILSFPFFRSLILVWETLLIYFYIGEYLFLVKKE